MATRFFNPDDDKKKGKKARRIFIPEVTGMPADAARADLRAMLPPQREQEEPTYPAGSVTGLRDDPSHVGAAPGPTGEEVKAKLLRAGVPVTPEEAKVKYSNPPMKQWKEDGRNPDMLLPLWMASRLHADGQGQGADTADGYFEMLAYIFEPPQNEEQWAEYRSWAGSLGSWSEMPKGALGVELPADMIGTAPGVFLGGRDILKDAANNESSWWNIFDAMGVLPVLGMLKHVGKAGDISKAARRAVRAAQLVDEVRLNRVVRGGHPDAPGSRAGTYIFDTPKGQVEVAVQPPGSHSMSGYVDDPAHRVTGPAGEDAPASETLWTSIKMRGGDYNRGNEGVIGNALTREIYRQVGAMFPEARWVGGTRVTGSAVGPASGREGGGVDTWVHMGERGTVNNSPAHRQLMDMAENDPEEYAKVQAILKEAGIDMSPEVLKGVERDMLARGIPHQLTPVELRNHEDRILDIFQRHEDPADAFEASLDYLEGAGIEARNIDTYEGTELGNMIVNGSLGDGGGESVVDILNPSKVTDTSFDEGLTALEDAGVNSRTGRVSTQRSYEDRLDLGRQRTEQALRDAGVEVDRSVVSLGEEFDDPDVINFFDEQGDNILHAQVRYDSNHPNGFRVDALSGQSDEVVNRIADFMRGGDVGMSDEVHALTTAAREGATRSPSVRAHEAARELPGEVADRYRRNIDNTEGRNPSQAEVYEYLRERQGFTDEAIRADSEFVPSAEQRLQMVEQGELSPGLRGDAYTNYDHNDLARWAETLVVEFDGDHAMAARHLVADGAAPLQARVAVDDAMDRGGYGIQRFGDVIEELEEMTVTPAQRAQRDRANVPSPATAAAEARGVHVPEVSAVRRSSEEVVTAAERVAESERAAAETSRQLAFRHLTALREQNPDLPDYDIEDAMRNLGWDHAQTQRAIADHQLDAGMEVGQGTRRPGTRPENTVDENIDAIRAHRESLFPQLNPDLPDDRFVSVYRRHRDADAPLDPARPASRTGHEGAERRRRELYPDMYHARTPFYVRGQAPESQFENMPIQIEARIPESAVYDIHADPKGYVQRLRDGDLESFTEVENLIYSDPDYSALADYETGQVWSFVEPQEIHRVNLHDGTFLNSDGSRLDPNDTPLSARGIQTPSQMEGDPVVNAESLRPLGVTEMQQRSRIRRGEAATYEQQAWPELTMSEVGDIIPDEAERANLRSRMGQQLGNLAADETGSKIVPGSGATPEQLEGLLRDMIAQNGPTPEAHALARQLEEMGGPRLLVPLEQQAMVPNMEPRSFIERAVAGVTERSQAGAPTRGAGAEALHRAMDDLPEITDWDIEMADLLNGGEGTTQRLDGRKPPRAERYMVSPDKSTETIFDKGNVTPLDVAAFRQAHGGALESGYFGAWVDGDDVYMDVSRGFSNRKAALDVAAAGDQQSIADLRKIEAEDWDNAFIDNPYWDDAAGRSVFPDERTETMTRSRVFEHMPELEAVREEQMLRGMSPMVREWFDGSRAHIQDRVREMHRMQLPREDLAAIMAMGQQTRGWYKGAAGSIGNAFGQDAFQFTALLAATSPNVPVRANTRYALDLWAEWNQWGRPRDPDAIQQMFDSVAGGRGGSGIEGHQVVPNANQNVIEVLSHPEPVEWFGDPNTWKRGNVLSGVKVDPFFANAIGELDRMTVDTHQLKYIAAPDNSLSRRAATEASFAEGADELARQLEMPEGLQVAEGQEMSWEFIRQMSEMSGRGRGSMEDMLFTEAGDIDMTVLEEMDARMAQAEDFSQFMGTEEARGMIGRAGGDPEFEQVHRTGVDDPARAREIALERPEAFRRAARRADMVSEGDFLMSVAPWMAAGLGAGLMRRLDPNDEKAPEQGMPRSLFDGVKLPGVGSEGSF